MVAGLIHIMSFGVTDLYLSGAPEITFFKMVYRRYTNFAKESIELPLSNINFGEEVEIEIPKVGDLISNSYLQINIPAVNIKKTDMVVDITTSQLQVLETPFPIENPSYVNEEGEIVEIDFKEDYELVKKYMSVNMEGYRAAIKNATIKNQTVTQYINSILDTIDAASASTPDIISDYQNTVENAYNYEVSRKNYVIASNLDYRFSDITFVLTTILNGIFESELLVYGFIDPDTVTVDNVLTAVEKAVENCQIIVNYYFENVKIINKKEEEANSQYAKFAWNERLGHSIIDYIDVKISGDKIDRHYGDWINLWVELTRPGDQDDLYKKMIGSVKEMVTFDRNKKPQYSLYIPLSFWFNRFNGLAFPMVALQFNKFYVSIRLKDLEDCAYIERLPTIDQEGNPIDFTGNTLALTDIWNNLNLTLTGNLLVDYVYLESLERKRMAQSAHEYLIETIELVDSINTSDNKQVMELDFTGPSKEIIFVCQKTAYTDNLTTETNKSNLKSLWFNYSTGVQKGKNPFSNIKLEFSGYDRFTARDSAQLNYLNPYSYHSNTPSPGVCVYPFSVFPEEFQPSGSCNFTRIQHSLLSFNLSNDMFKYRLSDIDPNIIPGSKEDEELSTTVDVRVYSRRYNILRVMHGFSMKAYH
jgi:Large eukaryotic DNA virus major capsid protein/Major capsid protein N-terminus